MTYLKFLKEKLFVGGFRRMEDQKSWPGLVLNQDFAKGRRLEPKVKK